ncbi:hypothetical protein AB0I81_40060 [Nonomuraea sp. NPDC050404]|uniref:hypothetical protein n=1 Tax=Nonomuraea sp. NPDC050404 TaxID=3155783 RepID=UPI0034094483
MNSANADRLTSYANTAIKRDLDARQRLAKSLTGGPAFHLPDLITTVLGNAGRAAPYRQALDAAEFAGDTVKGFRITYAAILKEVIKQGLGTGETPVEDLQKRADHEGLLTFLRDVGPLLGITR